MNHDFDVELLYAALDKKRSTEGLTWAGIAKEIGVAASTVKGIREKQGIKGDGVLQMLLWLDRSPESFVPGSKATKNHELEKPKDATLRFDVKKVYRHLDAKRTSEGLSWVQVAEQIGGFKPNMLQRLKDGGRTSFPGIARIARWLEVPMKDLTMVSPW